MFNTLCENKVNKQNKSVIVRNLFDNIAPVYDLLNNIISFGLHKRWKKQAIAFLEIKEGDKVLDLCCGSGDMTKLILDEKIKNINITATDFSSKMLDQARKRFDKTSLVNIIQADAMNLPFVDNSFDCIIISFGLRNLESIPDGLIEMKRVLKKGGRLVSIDFGKPKSPLFKLMFNLYFNIFVPIFGLLFKKFEEYSYLPSSIKNFPSPSSLVTLLVELEYKKAFYKDLFMGFVSMQSACK